MKRISKQVTTARKIEVAAWRGSHRLLISTRYRLRPFRISAIGGAVATLVFHVLALAVFTSSRPHKIRPETAQEPLLPQIKPSNQPAEDLIFIDLAKTRAGSSGERITASIPGLKSLPMKMKANLPAWQPLSDLIAEFADEREDLQPIVTSGMAESARLQGIYSGQIQARIERVWRRPRSPIYENVERDKPTDGKEYFQCQVQIVQDAAGNVQEVLVPDCNGSASWQKSLLAAIRQASPLPAPPDPAVFSRTVTINFLGSIPRGIGQRARRGT